MKVFELERRQSPEEGGARERLDDRQPLEQ